MKWLNGNKKNYFKMYIYKEKKKRKKKKKQRKKFTKNNIFKEAYLLIYLLHLWPTLICKNQTSIRSVY